RLGSSHARIEFNAQSRGFSAETETQNVQGQRFPVLQASARLRARALSHPRPGGSLRDDPEESVANLRKQMNVLVPVDEIRRPTKHIDKSANVSRDFVNEALRLRA